MIEPEMAFCNLDDNQDLAEAFLKSQVEQVMAVCAPDLEFLSKWYDRDLFKRLEGVLNSRFARIRYTEAMALLEKAGRAWEFPVHWGADLRLEHERYLTEDLFGKPVIITDRPRQVKKFYMRSNDDGITAASMDVLLPRIGKVIGGSQREERYDVLYNGLRDHEGTGSNEKLLWWYLDLRRFGSVEHSGFGMGFERMIMFLTGMKDIRDVIPFPRTPGRVEV
jgi:asparaginyl-tRNA synthetase